MSEKITSLNDILNAVKQQQQQYASGYWIPSLGKEGRFTEITTSQQKRLIKSVVDSPIFNTEFIYTFRDILKENCVDETINVDNLTLLDKLVLAIGLRATCIGPQLDIDVSGEDEKEIIYTLDLIDIYESIKNKTIKINNKSFVEGIFKIECGIPTIGTEYNLEKERRTTGENIDIETNAELREVLGEAFISEIVKYIHKVYMKQGDSFVEIDWDQLTFEERIKVVETFGMKLLREVINYINKIKEQFDKIELVKFEHLGKKYERRLTVDGRFFTIS